MKVNGNTPVFSNKNFKGYHAGIIADIALTSKLYLQPQLSYVRKGATFERSTEEGSQKIRIDYAELGTNLVYKKATSVGKLFAGAGVAGSYGFTGTQEVNAQKSDLYKKTSYWDRFDVGLNLTAGLELYNGMFISINSQKGFLDAYQGPGSIKHRSLSLSVGYFL
jgi:hypothetical protein